MTTAPAGSGWPPAGSPLALWQAERVAALLAAAGVAAELVVVDTEGDRRTDVPLAQLGGQGVFVKEVQAAVVRGDADAAVHSAKDLPASDDLGVPGWCWPPSPNGATPATCWSGPGSTTCATGAHGGHRVGPSPGAAGQPPARPHLRRPAGQPRHPPGPGGGRRDRRGGGRPGRPRPARLASARRAGGRDARRRRPCSPRWPRGRWPSSAGPTTTATRRALGGASTTPRCGRVVEAERAFLAELGGGCTLPVGAYAVLATPTARRGRRLRLTGMLAGADGHVVLRHEATGRRRARPRPGGGPLPAGRRRRRRPRAVEPASRDGRPGRRRPRRPRAAHPSGRRAAGAPPRSWSTTAWSPPSSSTWRPAGAELRRRGQGPGPVGPAGRHQRPAGGPRPVGSPGGAAEGRRPVRVRARGRGGRGAARGPASTSRWSPG